MSIKTNIKAAKIKEGISKVKDALLDVLGEVKEVKVNMDFDNKKHTVEIITR